MKNFFLSFLAILFVTLPLHADYNSPIMPEVQAKLNQLNPEKTLFFKYSFGVNGGSSAAAINLGPYYLPAGASVIRNYFYLKTPITSASGTPSVALACGNASLFATATTFGSLPGDRWVEGVATGATTAFSAGVGTSPCRPAITFTVQPPTAGDLRGYIKYVLPSVGSQQ